MFKTVMTGNILIFSLHWIVPLLLLCYGTLFVFCCRDAPLNTLFCKWSCLTLVPLKQYWDLHCSLQIQMILSEQSFFWNRSDDIWLGLPVQQHCERFCWFCYLTAKMWKVQYLFTFELNQDAGTHVAFILQYVFLNNH